MAKKVICIITQSHLCRNPRVLKEAKTLACNGYVVHILTSVYSSDLLEQDLEAIGGFNISLHIVADNSKRNLRSFINRFINKLAKQILAKTSLQTAWAVGYLPNKYIKAAIILNATLYICHQEFGLLIGKKLITLGYKTAFDLEDWHSEDLPQHLRKARPIGLLQKAERAALTEGIFATTTSNVLASALHEQYGGKLPTVIYNVFPSIINPFIKKDFRGKLKLFWFSQTIGPGRGIETFIALITNLTNSVELHLLGAVDEQYKHKLAMLLTTQHTLTFHPLVPENELLDKISMFDIGLALEQDESKSRNYTITNKFFQYIQAGLPVIATATFGQAEAFEAYHPGLLLPLLSTQTSAHELDKWLNNSVEINAAAKRAQKAAGFYNWENESKKILTLVNSAVS